MRVIAGSIPVAPAAGFFPRVVNLVVNGIVCPTECIEANQVIKKCESSPRRTELLTFQGYGADRN